ncbi:hypothetical protein Glove_52g59 [Diversispora epigaea]|uniref:Uncharacterized protein n=1 Tax=Diversispora epigaea TaxID=1348612 RepID=A0A397JDE1_9GLOM|nr:hypothetical protein Glove_52g59 [Diversispora epigaea]
MRLFLVPTLLLVGITTFAIGAPVAETIKVIEAVKIHQMESNITLNRRIISGLPGIPQCNDPQFPELTYSFCFFGNVIRAICVSADHPGVFATSDTPCPPNTECEDFETDPDDEDVEDFALCLGEEVEDVYSGDKEEVVCRSYEMNGITNGIATLSVNVFDNNQKPAQIPSISFSSENQSGSKSNTNNFSRVINAKNGQKVKVCLKTIVTAILLRAFFSFLDGAYSSKK